MDYGEAFTYVTKIEDWTKKMLVPVVFALVSLITVGLGAFLMMGWAIAVGRGVIRGQADPLPDWDDLGQMVIDGLKWIVVIVIWLIPIWVLAGIGAIAQDVAAVQILTGCCSFIYGVLVAILVPGVIGQLADEKPFVEVINPANAFKVASANWGNTIITLILASIMISLANVGLILCGIGLLVTAPYCYSVAGHLYGQFYRETGMSSKMAEAT